VTTWLALLGRNYFELAVSQGFHDGNLDMKWTKGIAITAKREELWDPIAPVTREDIHHIRNRLIQFEATAVILKQDQRPITPCATEWCRMIIAGSLAFASRMHRQPAAVPAGLPNAGAALGASGGSTGEASGRVAFDVLPGFRRLVEAARIPEEPALALFRDIEGLGAVNAYELQLTDWQGLSGWMGLRKLEQRRLLSVLHGPVPPEFR